MGTDTCLPFKCAYMVKVVTTAHYNAQETSIHTNAQETSYIGTSLIRTEESVLIRGVS